MRHWIRKGINQGYPDTFTITNVRATNRLVNLILLRNNKRKSCSKNNYRISKSKISLKAFIIFLLFLGCQQKLYDKILFKASNFHTNKAKLDKSGHDHQDQVTWMEPDFDRYGPKMLDCIEPKIPNESL